MVEAAETWHYGLVAKWWAEFNDDGPEIAYFQRFVESGQPALDVACGTGRLLIPYLKAGLDVDGCDVSPDMIALCRENAERAGLSPTLFVQPMHDLDPPRTYRTIFVCGGFGLGSDRDQDAESPAAASTSASNPAVHSFSTTRTPTPRSIRGATGSRVSAVGIPRDWPRLEEAERRRGSDGAEYVLQSRVIDIDPLEQRATYEMRAAMWLQRRARSRGAACAPYSLYYFANELRLMLEDAGFADIVLHGDHQEESPTRDSDFVVLIGKKPTHS